MLFLRKNSLHLFKPATVLKWRRELVKRTWTFQRRTQVGRPRVDEELEALIVRLATENPRLGYEKLQGELEKLGDDVGISTLIIDLFRQFYAFFIVNLGSRCVVHGGISDAPTDAWVAQQLREATPFGEGPKYLIRDNNSKYGPAFATVAAGANLKVLKIPLARRMPTCWQAFPRFCPTRAPGSSFAHRPGLAHPCLEGVWRLLQPSSSPSRPRTARS